MEEVTAIAKLAHPNIVQIYDFGVDEQFGYIVEEIVDGGTFQDRLAHPLPLDEVLRVTEPLADALDYAHSQGIIHRNIKPSNVLLDSVGRVKLGDFETEIMADRSHPATSESTFVGAAPYTSPEQALGRRADRKSDLYSLGVLLYQMIVGEVPFRKETVTSTLRSQIHDTVPSPSWLKPESTEGRPWGQPLKKPAGAPLNLG